MPNRTSQATWRPDEARASDGSPIAGPTTDPIRVIVADDSYMIREFLTKTLAAAPEVELVALCTDASELETAVRNWQPAVVITDIRMPPSQTDDGIRIATALRRSDPQIGVIVLSQHAEPAYALALLDGGTRRRGYLLKERIRDRAELIAAIKAVATGGAVIDPSIVETLIQARSRVKYSKLAQLTPRERELLAEIAAGQSNGAIAGKLSLTKRAVEKHVHAIFSKLDLPASGDVSRRVKATLIYLSEQDSGPKV